MRQAALLRKKQREEQKQKAISFEKLQEWVNKFVGDKSSAFVLQLKSAINGYTQSFKFKGITHFNNWLNSIDRQKVIKDSENYETYADAVSAKDVFDEYEGGLRSALTYCGSENLHDFRMNAELFESTSNFMIESNFRK